ncbi:LLM class flavin-dependent oxidoreductase [Candidatus Bathyarchaeota archaeon]|nr:LLM class flavin-dependent oxidoreductase [Candidatus Bathyarchaeota archaeon]
MVGKRSFGLNLPGFCPVLETAELSKMAENQGFEYVWIADENPAPSCRDVIVNMTTIALKTSKIKIGTGICNPYTRHPALLAVFASTLDELASGRVVLGLGPGGDMPLRPLGIKMWEKPLTTVREAVIVINRILSGETVDYDGEMIKVKKANLSFLPKAKIQIYLAARSPKFTRMIGEMADGSLLNAPFHYIKDAVSIIKEGTEKTGRSIADIDIGNILPFAVAKEDDKAKRKVKYLTAFMSAFTPNFVHEKLGTKIERIDAIRDALKKGFTEKAMNLMTNEMIDEFSISGKPDYCLERIEEFFKAGVTQMIFVIPDLKEVIKLAGTKIISSFKN